jgi:hypothetical protein
MAWHVVHAAGVPAVAAREAGALYPSTRVAGLARHRTAFCSLFVPGKTAMAILKSITVRNEIEIDLNL